MRSTIGTCSSVTTSVGYLVSSADQGFVLYVVTSRRERPCSEDPAADGGLPVQFRGPSQTYALLRHATHPGQGRGRGCGHQHR